MGIDYMAVCHERKEYLPLGRPYRQDPHYNAALLRLIIERWTSPPVSFVIITDGGSTQDLYHLIASGDVLTWGHFEKCGWMRGGTCSCQAYREIDRPTHPAIGL